MEDVRPPPPVAAKAAGAPRRKIRTGPLPHLPHGALAGPTTLEQRLIPGLLLGGVVGLLVVQLVLRLS